MDELSLELNYLLVNTFYNIERIENAKLQKASNGNLSIADFHLLECISKDDSNKSSMGKIAEALSVTLPTVAVAVKKLENKGYLTKYKSSSDGRVTYVVLTEKGKAMSNFHLRFHEQLINSVTDLLSDTEKHSLYDCMRKLNAFFDDKKLAINQKEGNFD